MLNYNELAAEYAKHRRVHPEVLRELIERGEVTAQSRILEVGCGTANYVTAIERATRCQAWGVDPSDEMLRTARTRSATIRFSPGRAEKLEYTDCLFDLVFSVDVIHHVVGRADYFREAFRVLKPGGQICTVTDSEDIIPRRIPLSTYFPETVERELARYPRVAELQDLMSAAGFVSPEERTVEFHYHLDDAAAFRDRAFSSLHLIPQQAYERGLRRMEADLQKGPIPCISWYTMLWGHKQ